MYPTKEIKAINFSILTKNQLKKITTFPDSGIVTSEIYDNSEYKKNGLLDPRMGTTRMGTICSTCRLNNQYCPGHFGHINLAYPIIHIGYIIYIKSILGCICNRCSCLKINPHTQRIEHMLKHVKGIDRLNIIKELTKDIKTCRNCNAPLPKIKILNKKEIMVIDFIAEYQLPDQQIKKVQLTNVYIYNIFKNISDEDCIILGLDPTKSRPEDLFYTYFPVAPIPSRPSVQATDTIITDDNITELLSNIIKNNNDIISNKDKAGIEKKIQIVQYYANIIYSNSNQLSLKLEADNPYQGIFEKIKSKEGIIRSNLMGKRNNYTARTVITGDPMLQNDQVGIPLYIAKILTYTEIVTKENIDKLKICLANGPNIYPGANMYMPINEDGTYTKSYILKMVQSPFELKIGDKIERHMMDDDIVFFNRQPSLHKYSMMAMRAKILNNPSFATFRFNVGITEPFHADFDGDEMTITIPRSIQSEIEIDELASLRKLLVNAQTSTTTVGCKLDTLTAAYMLTRFENNISASRVMSILSYLQETPNISRFIVDKNKIYTGKELLSFIIPKKVNVYNKQFVIKNGEFIKGYLNKFQLKDKMEDSLLRIILDLYDENEAKIFFDNIQKMLNIYFINKGITFGVKDIETPKDIHDKAQVIIKEAFLEVGQLTTEIENDQSLLPPDVYEDTVKQLLHNTRDKCAKLIMDIFEEDSNIQIMVNAGTNGKIKDVNIAKNLIVDAQNDSFGQRLAKADGRRTQPYFCRDIDMPYERGYNSNGFYHGLNLYEFIWDAIIAREGIIDIQIHTPDSGYTQRKFVKIMEDFHVDYDGLVKNVNDNIIQFAYSDFNIDATKQYKCKIELLTMNDKDIKNKYIFTDSELKEFNDYTNEDNEQFYNYLLKTRDIIRENQIKLVSGYIAFDNLCYFYLPISLNKIHSIMKYGKKSDLTPSYIINKIDELLLHENTQILCIKQKDIHNKSSILINDENLIKTILKLYLYEVLCPKRCIYEYKLSKDNFNYLIDDIIISIKRSLINPGEMVGVIAGTSLCENITQTNLNSHHLTGVTSKTSATSGFERMVEIFNYTKDIKTQQTILYFDEKTRTNKNYIYQVMNYIRETLLNEIYESINVYYDPDNNQVDKSVNNIFKIKDLDEYQFYSNDFSKLPWLIVINLQKNVMLTKNIQLLDIIIKIIELWNNKDTIIKKSQLDIRNMFNSIIKLSIASNNDNDDTNIICIRFNMIDYSYNTIETLSNFILDYTLIKGVSNIKESDTLESLYTTFDNETHAVDETQNEYYIQTIGINIDRLRNIKGVDQLKSKINDIHTIYQTYGIETVRLMIIDELNHLLQNNVKFNHISLIADYMTREGYILSVDRNGLDKSDASLLSKISFEKPGPKILNACLFNESDNLNGVSGRIMTGKMMRGGTGYCDLLFNSDIVMNSEYTDYNILESGFIDVNEDYNSFVTSEMNIDDDIYIP